MTDLALGVEAASFAVLLARDDVGRGSPIRRPFITFFVSTAVASFAGAALHGLLADRSDPRRRALWRGSLASIGIASLSSWWLGARLALADRATLVIRLATWIHVPYLVAVLRVDRPFWFAIVSYVPGAMFLTATLVSRLRDPRDRGPSATALVALVVTFAAALVQVGRVGVHRRFDHNAVYHSLQSVGVAMLFGAARGFLRRPCRQVIRRH